MLSALLVTLLWAAPPAEVRKESGVDALGIPLVSYNSDVGLGLGAVGGAYFYSPGFRPYRHAVALQTFFTSFGVQSHWLRYDGPRLLAGARLEARIDFRRELFSPFFGAGNRSAPDFSGDMRDRHFTYDKLSPGAWLRVRAHPLGEDHPLQSYAGYAFRFTNVTPYPGSLLERGQPRGTEGGPTGQLLLGLLWDTRDNEADPTRGGMEELSVRLASRPTASAYTYGGLTLVERRFWRLSRRSVLAQRLTLDVLFGDIPFFEWPNLGGTHASEGIGGMSSVRGVPRSRFAGNVKVVSNTELRFYAWELPLWGEPVKVGGLAFLDVGRAWHPGVEDGPWHAWHPGLGGGVRIARRAAVLRFDYAVAPESGRQGIYISFGHMF